MKTRSLALGARGRNGRINGLLTVLTRQPGDYVTNSNKGILRFDTAAELNQLLDEA